MGTNSYVTKLKAQLNQAIIQREHWKQLAENRNSIVVTEVCPESRSVEEYIIDADSVRSSWRLIRRYREQAEALRAENGRLREHVPKAQLHALEMGQKALELARDLEAARGLLRHASSALGIEGWESISHEIDTFLTATPAPEVQDHIERHLTMAEQGERQEAVAWKVVGTHPKHRHPHLVVEHTLKLAEGQAAHWRNRGCSVEIIPLYTTPQPGPDVRGLVEALEWYEQQAAGCRKLTSEGDDCRQALDSDGGKRAQTALAAHRQAQRPA